MKLQPSQQIRVGIFVFLGVVLAMSVVFLLGRGFGLFERQYTLYIRFEKVSGLRVGAPVFLAGIQVGQVKHMQFSENIEAKEVLVELDLKRAFQDRIRVDSEASIVTQGLLGDKAIFVTLGTPQAEALKNGEEIKVKVGFSVDDFAEKGSDLLENINQLAKNANELIKDAKEKEGLLHALIYDKEGAGIIRDLRQVTRDAQKIISQVNSGRGVLHALIYDPVDKDLGRYFSETAKKFRSLSADLEQAGEKIRKGEGSIGGLINDPTVYYDLMTLLGKANRNKLLRTVIRATLATNEKDLNQ